MSGSEGTVGDLQASIARAIEEIGRMQSAIALVRDRGQNAADMLRIATEGSGRDEVSSALAAITACDELADQLTECTHIVIEQLGGYAGTL